MKWAKEGFKWKVERIDKNIMRVGEKQKNVGK